MQVVLHNVQGTKPMLVLSQLISIKTTLNTPLLVVYTYHFSLNNDVLTSIHFVNVINSYASFATTDENYWNVLIVTMLWKITDG